MTLAPETVSRLAYLRDQLEREPADPVRVLRRADRRARRIASPPPSGDSPQGFPEAEPQSPPTRIADPRPYRGPLIYVPRAMQAAFEAEGGSGDLVLLIEAAIPGPVAPRWVNLDGWDVQLARTASPFGTRRAWRAVQVRRRQPVNPDPEGAP